MSHTAFFEELFVDLLKFPMVDLFGWCLDHCLMVWFLLWGDNKLLLLRMAVLSWDAFCQLFLLFCFSFFVAR